ncbi:MAG: CotH kinase family protein [Rubripirellula sp.]
MIDCHTYSPQIPNKRMAQRFLLIAAVAAISLATSFAQVPVFAQTPNEPSSTRDDIYAPDHLLDVRIQVDPADWDRLRHQTRSLMASLAEDNSSGSPFEYVAADVTIDGRLIENVGIRKKGFLGSLDNDRPSLKIRFDEFQDQAPFGDLDRLTLNNNKQDPSRLSQYLSYEMFRRAGVPCSLCNFAKVTVNGKKLGIYSNVEAIKPPMLNRAFGEGSGLLFEGTVTDFIPGTVDRFEMKTKKGDRDQLQQIASLLAANPLDIDRLDTLIDTESFLRFWAVESLIGFWDGYTHNQNNFYLYRNPSDSKFYFLPWGTDSAFTDFVPPIIEKIAHRSFHSNATIANRLYRKRETRNEYLATLRHLLDGPWDEEEIADEIERVRALLADETLDANAFSKAVDGVHAFVRNRRKVIEDELQRFPIPLRTGPRRPGFTRVLGKVTANFETQWSKPRFFQSGFQGDAEIQLVVDGKPVPLRNMRAAAAYKSANFGKKKSDAPTLTLSAVREADATPLSFSLAFSPADFKTSGRPVPCTGLFIEGSMITFMAMMSANPSAIKLVDGTANLDEASIDEGAAVTGSANFRIMSFAGGEKENVEWEE